MARIHLTNNPASWFDNSKAECFMNATYWNGNNWINKITNEQFKGEKLYITASGNFVMCKWSNYQGIPDTYEEITRDQAALWLLENEHYDKASELSPGIVEGNEI